MEFPATSLRDGDRPGIGNGMTARPEELLFMVYMDYSNCTDSIHTSQLSLPGGTRPLGAEIHQIVFNFNCFPLRDMYFTKFRIINKSPLNWDSVYITSANDPDLGSNASDEPAGCDTTRNLGLMIKMQNNDPGDMGLIHQHLEPGFCKLRYFYRQYA